ncbi:cysteine hydrolase family protein [Caldiplasma sukawensis]
MSRAFIVVDLVNDFVKGKFGSSEAVKIAEKAYKFLKSRENEELIIFTMDSHIKDDPEFKVWGEHCLENTEGSELYGSLNEIKGFKIKKRHYDSFYDSDLDGILRAHNINDVFIFGISTDICVMHTVSGAFFRYYKITVIEDLCAAINGEISERAINEMKRLYGISVVRTEVL